MLPYKRAERVAKLIKKETNNFLQREIDTNEYGIITITDTEVSDDLQHASIYYSIYGSEKEKQSALEFLVKITPSLRYYIGKNVKLRLTPEIVFKYDNTIERAARIDELINKIHKADEEKEKT